MPFEKQLSTINPVQIGEIKQKTVCIVRFDKILNGNDVRPGLFFQVTIDPESFSPDGRFIRFGNHPGDEILGWQPVEWIVIEAILAEWDQDQPPKIKLSKYGGVTQLLE